jgi:iron complex transport system substrate-binding protein
VTVRYPERIVCLTEEPTEVLYALGEQDRIVGISGFTVRPPRARREKPKVSAFLSAKIERILDLKPDLAIGFSDIQADIAQALIKAGVEVWISNHRSVEGIRAYILRLGAMVGAVDKARAYLADIDAGNERIRAQTAAWPKRPRVYVEEWDEPRISGIQWVAELVRIAGGDDIFPELAAEPLARQRILANDDEILRRAPELVLGSWCGKKFRPDLYAPRLGRCPRCVRRTGRNQVATDPATGSGGIDRGSGSGAQSDRSRRDVRASVTAIRSTECAANMSKVIAPNALAGCAPQSSAPMTASCPRRVWSSASPVPVVRCAK